MTANFFSPTMFLVGGTREMRPTSLMLPAKKIRDVLLCGEIEGSAFLVLLTGDYRFRCLKPTEVRVSEGLIFPDVLIDVDLASVISRGGDRVRGCVVRSGKSLGIVGFTLNSWANECEIQLTKDLPESSGEAAFLAWRVVKGSGKDRQVLWSVDLREDS